MSEWAFGADAEAVGLEPEAVFTIVGQITVNLRVIRRIVGLLVR